MSYDGGTIVKINNPTLLKILKKYDRSGLKTVFSLEEEEYDLYYEYLDCAYVEGCPKDLDDLKTFIYELINSYNGFSKAFIDFSHYFEENYSKIKSDFSYVKWIYYPPVDEEENEEEFDNEVIFEYGKEKKKKAKKPQSIPASNLSEIFPNMDVSKENGLVTKDGKELLDYNRKQHNAFLGEEFCLFLPSNIVSIDPDTNAFNSPTFLYNKFVITTNFEEFPSYCFMIMGFKRFYIVDAETNQVVYASDEFEYVSSYSFISLEDKFNDLYKNIKKYTKCR